MKKPLTHGTPDEEKRVEQIMARKQEYKHARTVYSDAMIDYDAEVSQGAEPRQRTLEAIEDAKARYEEQSERVTEAALHFEALYREGTPANHMFLSANVALFSYSRSAFHSLWRLSPRFPPVRVHPTEVCQRIEAHFMSLNHFIRGLYTCFRGYYPYVRSLSFDAREQRSAMKRHVAEAKLEAERDDRVSSTVAASLPKVPYGRSVVSFPPQNIQPQEPTSTLPTYPKRSPLPLLREDETVMNVPVSSMRTPQTTLRTSHGYYLFLCPSPPDTYKQPKPKSNLDVGSTKMALDSGGLDSMEGMTKTTLPHIFPSLLVC